NDNVATDLTKATSITVKLGNASGYLKSATVDPASLTDPTTGQVTVTFNADLMTSLTAGSYSIEVWVVDNTGTSIYPSDGSTGFTITNNIQSANGSTITTITFDDFVAAMNKAASTIAKGDKGDKGDTGATGPQGLKGDKGDTGTVDNAGLISAPAFQSLQTQVNNSAVGTNLIPMSNTTGGFVSLVDGTITNADSTLERVTDFIEVEPNQTYCMQEEIHLLTGQYLWFCIGLYDGNKTFISRPNSTEKSVTSDGTAFQKWTVVIPENAKYARVSFVTYGDKSARFKFEKGSVATDWCPNPTEILTQSDYAKIKAAIVALGGSLS
ncbi:collagen-like protein, partial [Lactiplantibacillus plantarum]|uniref:collagen-like protein n=1 Tax=Lactiplantibacillus plantarum TaxID=1590 RepID=UPI0037540B13